ncbi:MAG: YbhB/YbcL family Raf kinase inhibitor-like protein [Dehalococcoidia bacterium]|nr:YbhB/YbcL family Raf kinase inhibitor-like protein [Dehalococcoidia bacterium]
MKLEVLSYEDGQPIPGEFAFCVPADEGHVAMGSNRSPHVRWSEVPDGTQSLALIMHDPDVPSVPDDVNQEGRTVAHDLPRVDFYHWVLVDISHDTTEMPAGADADGITAGGKAPGPTGHGVRGVNNYTDWFAGDADMSGVYAGYDGPCPPWNDERLHHYHLTLYALDVESLGLSGNFGGPEALAGMEGHILAQASWVGTYTLNPTVEA